MFNVTLIFENIETRGPEYLSARKLIDCISTGERVDLCGVKVVLEDYEFEPSTYHAESYYKVAPRSVYGTVRFYGRIAREGN